MDDEEAALKAKLDATENIEERLELRKQLRELRNRKFDEELKKISSGETSSSKLTNDINSRKSIRRVESSAENGDPYGLLAYTTEQSLQDLLNDTPYTETDKRRKIRARMREIRNGDFDTTPTPSSKTKTEEYSSRPNVRQPSPEPERRKVREPSPEPVREPSPEPIREPTPSPTPSPEPERESSPEPEREPSPEPYREPSPERYRDPSPQPSPEPVREPSPEPLEETRGYYHKSEMDRNRYEDEQETSDLEREENDSGNEYDSEESPYDSDSESMSRDEMDSRQTRSNYRGRDVEPPAAVVEKVLQTAEPGIRDGSDFKDRLKKRQDSHAPLALERPIATEGEQIDFRKSLKRKSEAPAVNLERKPEGPEQVDFRTALARKVETPVKDEEPTGGVQVDFRTALKKKVEKPVFDKNPVPAAQVDFRNNLVKKVQTRTMEDKNLGCEQKDFRVVLGKAPPSPKTGRRHRSLNTQESVDRTPEDLEKDLYVTDLSALPETPSPRLSASNSLENVSEQKSNAEVFDSGDDSKFARRPSKKAAPPPPPKKKNVNSKLERSEKTNIENEQLTSNNEESIQRAEQANEEPVVNNRTEEIVDKQQENFKSQPREDSDDDVDGSVRNRQIARAERSRRRQEKEAAKTAKEPVEPVSEPPKQEEEDKTEKTGEEQTYRRTRRTQDSPGDTRSERSSRRTRRLKALDDGSSEDQKKVEIHKKEQNHENIEEKVNKDASRNNDTAKMNGVSENHKEESKVEMTKETVEEKTESVEYPLVNGDAKPEEVEENAINRTDRSSSRKKKEEEKVSVSADLLAEINKPKEEPPKKSIESQLRANKAATPRATNLTGKAAEREAERLRREAEREERAAARAREREEAARKRREQKEAFEKKMAEQKKARELKQRSNVSRVGSSTRDSMKAFKEKLESNSPAPAASPSPISQPNSNLTKLLGWARKRTKDYEGVNVENFHDSWSDGLAFAALIHSFCPDDIPFDELDKTNRRRNFELAFSVAREEGVLDLLDVEDMVRMRSPDPKSVMTYVHSIYQVFQQTS